MDAMAVVMLQVVSNLSHGYVGCVRRLAVKEERIRNRGWAGALHLY